MNVKMSCANSVSSPPGSKGTPCATHSATEWRGKTDSREVYLNVQPGTPVRLCIPGTVSVYKFLFGPDYMSSVGYYGADLWEEFALNSSNCYLQQITCAQLSGMSRRSSSSRLLLLFLFLLLLPPNFSAALSGVASFRFALRALELCALDF